MNSTVVDIQSVHQAFESGTRVRSFTHAIYRHPARFSPQFARAALVALTRTGDLVLDPFMGGGTTAVESIALGRRMVGIDINALALAVAQGKTTLLAEEQLEVLCTWASKSAVTRDRASSDPRLTNAPEDLIALLAPYRNRLQILRDPQVRGAARLVLLEAAQWALEVPSTKVDRPALRARIATTAQELAAGLRDLRSVAPDIPSPALHLGAAQDVLPTLELRGVRLVLTSPPYPGIHVLYHRWQVRGRRETPLPYWIAEATDGKGPRHYMMGSRRTLKGEIDYFDGSARVWRSVRPCLADDALVLQVIAFADPLRQLPKYLEVMKKAGYLHRPDLEPTRWRMVPNRRWYNRVEPQRASGREMLLVHSSG